MYLENNYTCETTGLKKLLLNNKRETMEKAGKLWELSGGRSCWCHFHRQGGGSSTLAACAASYLQDLQGPEPFVSAQRERAGTTRCHHTPLSPFQELLQPVPQTLPAPACTASTCLAPASFFNCLTHKTHTEVASKQDH